MPQPLRLIHSGTAELGGSESFVLVNTSQAARHCFLPASLDDPWEKSHTDTLTSGLILLTSVALEPQLHWSFEHEDEQTGEEAEEGRGGWTTSSIEPSQALLLVLMASLHDQNSTEASRLGPMLDSELLQTELMDHLPGT